MRVKWRYTIGQILSGNNLSLVGGTVTCDVLQTGVSQLAAGGQVEVLEFDQAGDDRQPGVWTKHSRDVQMKQKLTSLT